MSDISYYNINDFPKLKILSDNWQVIREEALAVPRNYININRVDKDHETVAKELMFKIHATKENGWVFGWSNKSKQNRQWIQYGIMLHDSPVPYNNMPKTTDLLNQVRGIKIAALNILKRESILGTHTHPEIAAENLAQMHICLDSEPNQSYLCVNEDFFQYETGNYTIFDGSQPHFVINAADKERLILYIEFKK